MNARLLTLTFLISLLLTSVSTAQAAPPVTTIYLPVVTNPAVAQANSTAAGMPTALGHTFYLPLITQGDAASDGQVEAAWLNWPGLFSFGTTNTFSLKIEKRNFDAGGDGEQLNLLEIPLLIDLYKELTVPNYNVQKVWGIKNAQLDKAQTVSKGTGVVVAVVDTGFSLLLTNALLRTKAGYDFVGNDIFPMEEANWWDDDRDGQIDEGMDHGTFISSIILANTRDARIMPVRVLNSDGSGAADTVAKGIRYAVDHGAQIINLSLSGSSDEPGLRDAVAYAIAKGVVVIAAAASNSTTLGYPAAYPQVIAVGAINQNNAVADFALANANQITVFAPGAEIYGTSKLGSGIWMSGNSMAAAFVSAEAALLMSKSGCQATCVRTALTSRVNPVSPAQNGRGRIDAYQAVQQVP